MSDKTLNNNRVVHVQFTADQRRCLIPVLSEVKRLNSRGKDASLLGQVWSDGVVVIALEQPTINQIQMLTGAPSGTFNSAAERMQAHLQKPAIKADRKVEITPLRSLSKDDAALRVEEAVYRATVDFLEAMEGARLRGNGHHMAQQLAAQANALVKERWIDSTEGGTS